MVLINQRLQVEDQIRIGRAQGNADNRQLITQPNRIQFLLGETSCSKNADGVAGTSLLQQPAARALEIPAPLAAPSQSRPG
jgi:hypothetical protein